MLITKIIGAVIALSGIAIAVFGCIRCRNNIKRDSAWLPADGEIIGFADRTVKVKYRFVITVAKTMEYSPIIRYRTESGETVESACLPYTLKLSPSYKEYEKLYHSGERIAIKYDPEHPEMHFYKSRTGQYIREAFYKIFAGLIILGIGILIHSFE